MILNLEFCAQFTIIKCENKITMSLNMQNARLDWMYNLWDTVQNENVGPLV